MLVLTLPTRLLHTVASRLSAHFLATMLALHVALHVNASLLQNLLTPALQSWWEGARGREAADCMHYLVAPLPVPTFQVRQSDLRLPCATGSCGAMAPSRPSAAAAAPAEPCTSSRLQAASKFQSSAGCTQAAGPEQGSKCSPLQPLATRTKCRANLFHPGR